MKKPDLQALIDLPGAIAAFAYGDDGDLNDYRILNDSDMSEAVLDMVAHMCAANRCIASMQARGWERVTGAHGFYPVHGFGLVGFDWSVIARGRLGVVMESAATDFEHCIKVLDRSQDGDHLP